MPKSDLWFFDLYKLARPLLFELEPEKAHKLALNLLKKGLGPKDKSDAMILHTTVCGMSLRNPIGLAAGFDKNAEVIDEAMDFGFGFVEIGTITPRPQPGNPQPRLFRAQEVEAAINRFGFNSDGMDACLWRIKAWHDARQEPIERSRVKSVKIPRGLIGINIGKNRDSTDAVADYVAGIKKLSSYADYVTINISSPNTPGLRDLQAREPLTELVQAVLAARAQTKFKMPIFIKIAPDVTDAQMADIAEVTMTAGIEGIILGNTTSARPGHLPADFAREEGGLSGKPLFDSSTRALEQLYKLTQGKITLIGTGGVSSGADAYAKIRAGASLVQLYTALIFEGPGLVRRIKRDLAALLQRDGFKSVSEAVGTGKP
jgi:dihydroorotate dehydrogenase